MATLGQDGGVMIGAGTDYVMNAEEFKGGLTNGFVFNPMTGSIGVVTVDKKGF